MAPFLTSFVFCQRLEIFSVISTVFYSVFNAWMWCDVLEIPRGTISVLLLVYHCQVSISHIYTHIYIYFCLLSHIFKSCVFIYCVFWFMAAYYVIYTHSPVHGHFAHYFLHDCVLSDSLTVSCDQHYIFVEYWIPSIHTCKYLSYYRTDHCIYQVLIKCVRIY